jgi:hypothetical protein
MIKKNLKGNRIIKKELNEIKKNDIYLDPFTLEIGENTNNESIYLTKYYFDDNKNLLNTTKNKNNILLNDKFMLIPPLLISTNNFLKIYDINCLNELIIYIDKNLETKSYDSLNRIINCWIRDNFEDLKKNNKILCNIYFKIFNNFYNYKDEKDFIKNTSNYIEKWFNLNDKDNFKLNLGNDIKKYLSKKYES